MSKKKNLKDNISMNLPFGYKYDKEKETLVINELQADVVRAFIDLRITYLLEYEEIYYLCINYKTIDEIIYDRIDLIYDTLNEYNFKIDNPFNNIDIIKVLKQETEIKDKILEPLIYTNKKIRFKHSEKYKNISVKIDKVIKLIEQRSDLLKQYDFKKIADTINEYNGSLKQRQEHSTKIEKDFSLFSSDSHKAIIDKETWEKAQSLYNKKKIDSKEEVEEELER